MLRRRLSMTPGVRQRRGLRLRYLRVSSETLTLRSADYSQRWARLLHLTARRTETTLTLAMELTLIFSLFGAVALTLVVPAIRGMGTHR